MDDESGAVLAAAKAARLASDFLPLETLGRRLIALGESSGDASVMAVGYFHLGIALNNLNRASEAADATRRSIALYEGIGDRFAAARAMMNLGTIELDNGNVEHARRLYEQSTPALRELGEPIHLAIALGNLGELYRLEGDYRRALKSGRESLAIFETLDGTDNVVWQLTNIAHYQLLLRNPDAAVERMLAAYALLRANQNPRWIAAYFDLWFIIATALARFDTAVQLLAFADKYRDEHNQPRLQAMLPWLSTPKEQLARELAHERYEALVLAGEALTVASAQQLAEAIRPLQ